MARVIVTEGFVDDAAKIELQSKREEVGRAIGRLEAFLEMGSKVLPVSVEVRFGIEARRLTVNPFDIIYTYDLAEDVVLVVGLIHQREAM